MALTDYLDGEFMEVKLRQQLIPSFAEKMVYINYSKYRSKTLYWIFFTASTFSANTPVGISPFEYVDEVCGGLPPPTNTKIQIHNKETDDDKSKKICLIAKAYTKPPRKS
jgi:hypothetical protein